MRHVAACSLFIEARNTRVARSTADEEIAEKAV